jgi:hypothetical protein
LRLTLTFRDGSETQNGALWFLLNGDGTYPARQTLPPGIPVAAAANPVQVQAEVDQGLAQVGVPPGVICPMRGHAKCDDNIETSTAMSTRPSSTAHRRTPISEL